MRVVARVAGEHLGQAVELEQRRRLEHRTGEALEMSVEAEACEADRERRLLDRPHRAAMIAVRVVRRMA